MAPNHNQLFIIGGQRSGTTFLTNLINQHPLVQFTTPTFPESKFFIRNPKANADHFYKEFFPIGADKLVVAEKSTSYFEHDLALRAIADNFPNALIIFIYRNPVERAISNYMYSRKNGLETRTAEEVFLENVQHPGYLNGVSVNPFDYLGRSKYSLIIPRIERNFLQKNLLFIDFDTLTKDFEFIVGKVFKKLGVDPYKPSSKVGINEATREVVSAQVKRKLSKTLESEFMYLENRFK